MKKINTKKMPTLYSEKRLVDVAFKIGAVRTYLNKIGVDIGRIDNAISAIDEFYDEFQIRNKLCQWRYDDCHDCYRITCDTEISTARWYNDFKYCPYCGNVIKKC